jgi:hypothetical protein
VGVSEQDAVAKKEPPRTSVLYSMLCEFGQILRGYNDVHSECSASFKVLKLVVKWAFTELEENIGTRHNLGEVRGDVREA